MEKAQTILIVDPETDFLEWVQHQLETPTTRVMTATNAEEGYKTFCREDPDLLIAETHLAPFSGMELLVKVRQRDPNAIVVLTSAFGTTQAVIESMRHKGIARALVKQALEVGVAQAARCAVLELRASNHAAHALYRSLGFRDVTTRPTYYTNPIEDALLMELDPIVSESGRLTHEVGREGGRTRPLQ